MAHDVARLPKWAQHRIAALERDLLAARATINAGPENSDTFADPYSEASRPLGSEPLIRFYLGNTQRDYIDCMIVRDRHGAHLRVLGSDSLNIEPSSGNVVQLRAERFRAAAARS